MKPEKKFEFSAVLSPAVVIAIADSIKKVWEPFDQPLFEANLVTNLSGVPFKERANLIAKELYERLPKDFGQAGRILLDSFGEELETPEFSGDMAFMSVGTVWKNRILIWEPPFCTK